MAVGPGGINYMPKKAGGNLAGYGQVLTSPFAQQIQQLASQLGGGAGVNLAQNIPAPNLAPGTYDGAYAAQGLRTSNSQQAAQLWESRHPAAMHSGNIPPWVMQAQPQELQNHGDQAGGGQMNPHQVLNDIVAHHRASNGLPAIHPAELHGRVTALAHEILHGRNNRLQQALRGIRPPVAPQQAPPGPVGGPYQAQ